MPVQIQMLGLLLEVTFQHLLWIPSIQNTESGLSFAHMIAPFCCQCLNTAIQVSEALGGHSALMVPQGDTKHRPNFSVLP